LSVRPWRMSWLIVGIRSYPCARSRTRIRFVNPLPVSPGPCANARNGSRRRRRDKKSSETRGRALRHAKNFELFRPFNVWPRRNLHFAREPEFRAASRPTFRPLLKGGRNIGFAPPSVKWKRKILSRLFAAPQRKPETIDRKAERPLLAERPSSRFRGCRKAYLARRRPPIARLGVSPSDSGSVSFAACWSCWAASSSRSRSAAT
jgi:hypothetical protein